MKVIFTKDTNDDFIKYVENLKELKKRNPKQYSYINPRQSKVKFRRELIENVGKINNHKDSIFPKEFDYSSDSHKMYVDKKSHHVVFYKVITPKKGEPYISIEKCIHSTELRKKLEEKGIKPLKNCDKSLLDDLETVYKEDDVKLRDDSEDEKEEWNESIKNMKSVKSYITESKMISLIDYLKKMVG